MTLLPQSQCLCSEARSGDPSGAHLEPVPFLFLVQDRSPPGLVGRSFRTSMPPSAFCSPSSTTSQVGQHLWQHPGRSGGRGLRVVLDTMEMHLPSLCEGEEDSSAQGTCEYNQSVIVTCCCITNRPPSSLKPASIYNLKFL